MSNCLTHRFNVLDPVCCDFLTIVALYLLVPAWQCSNTALEPDQDISIGSVANREIKVSRSSPRCF